MRGPRCATAALAMMIVVIASAPAVHADASTQVVQGQYVRLVSVADWDAAQNLRPGASVRWDVAVSADAPEAGTLTVGVSARGDASLRIHAVLCMNPWEGESCPGGARTLVENWSVPRDGTLTPLAEFDAAREGHLRLQVALDQGAAGSSELRVYGQGAGDSVSVGPGDDLAATGMSPFVPVLFGLSAALLLLGAVLALTTRPRDAVRRRR